MLTSHVIWPNPLLWNNTPIITVRVYLYCCQGLIDISNNIVYMFDADGQAYITWRHTST